MTFLTRSFKLAQWGAPGAQKTLEVTGLTIILAIAVLVIAGVLGLPIGLSRRSGLS
jgi:hypothetical protein